MKPFTITFIGRKLLAIGIRYKITETVEAENIEQAVLKLYENYDSVSVLEHDNGTPRPPIFLPDPPPEIF